MDRERFEELVGAFQDGDASPGELAEMERLLRADPALRRVFVERSVMEVQLRKALTSRAAEEEARRPAPRMSAARRLRGKPARAAWIPALLAAGFLVALALLLATQGSRRGAEAPRPEAARLPEAELSLPEPQPLPVPPREAPPAPSVEKPPEPVRPEPPARPPEAAPGTVEPVKPAEVAPPKPPAPATTAAAPPRPAAGAVERAQGGAFVVAEAGKRPAAPGQPVLAGQGVGTAGGGSRLTVAFADKTRLELGAETEVADLFDREPAAKLGKRLALRRGTLVSDISRQPADQPMVVTTPHGEVRVLGTVLRVVVDRDSTRVEVREGKVRLTRIADGRFVEVPAGFAATARAGADLAPRRLPEEIVLLPRSARVAGGEWSFAADEGALEAPRTTYKVYESVRKKASFAVFAFNASANKDYHVWIRARTLAREAANYHDEVAIELAGAKLGRACRYLSPFGDEAFVFNDFSRFGGRYGWIGGHGEGEGDVPPLMVRFARAGPQTLKLYAIETPIRVEAIWLSETQKTRPEPDFSPAWWEMK